MAGTEKSSVSHSRDTFSQRTGKSAECDKAESKSHRIYYARNSFCELGFSHHFPSGDQEAEYRGRVPGRDAPFKGTPQ